MKTKYLALCGSFECTGINSHLLKHKDFVVKDAKPNATTCADCNHALRWVKEKNRRHKVVSKGNQQMYGRQKLFNMNEK